MRILESKPSIPENELEQHGAHARITVDVLMHFFLRFYFSIMSEFYFLNISFSRSSPEGD